VFGRRKHQEQEEAAREAERRALFEELAKRPDTICPFLGLEQARTEYRDRVSEGHRCYAFGEPAELSAEQQQKVCLQRGYGNCPRYLRGVLVIPTEELEALRHPQPAPPPVPAAPPPPPPASGGGRRGLIGALIVLLLAFGGGGAAFLALANPGGVADATPTPTAGAASPSQQVTQAPGTTPPASASTSAEPTPVVIPSGTALPTPAPSDTFTGYAVRLDAGSYGVVVMETDGTIVRSASAVFDSGSWAPVARLEVDGATYWRTLVGGYTGYAYSQAVDDRFVIYATYQTAGGEPRFRELDPDEY